MATASDGTTTTVTTDAQGRFTMDLREGTYVVIAVTPERERAPDAGPADGAGRRRGVHAVTLEVDTGIR